MRCTDPSMHVRNNEQAPAKDNLSINQRCCTESSDLGQLTSWFSQRSLPLSARIMTGALLSISPHRNLAPSLYVPARRDDSKMRIVSQPVIMIS